MGLGEAFNDTIEGLIYLAILGTFIVGLWPMLVQYFGNAEVYGAWGTLILGIIALIVVVFALAIIQRIFRQSQKERKAISGLFGRKDEDDFE